MIIKIKCEFPIGDLYYANQEVDTESATWKSRITSTSTLRRAIDINKGYEVSDMTITLSDKDRYFRDMMNPSGDNQYIYDTTVTVSNEIDATLFTGTVSDWAFPEEAFSITVSNKLIGYKDKVLSDYVINSYTIETNFASEANGEPIPVIYGRVESPRGAIKAWRIDDQSYKFIIARHDCYSLDGAWIYNPSTGVYIDGSDNCSLVNDTNYAYCTASEYDFISAGFADGVVPDYIYVNVSGTKTGADLMENPIDCLKDFINNYATNVSYDDATMNVSRALMATRRYKAGYCIQKIK